MLQAGVLRQNIEAAEPAGSLIDESADGVLSGDVDGKKVRIGAELRRRAPASGLVDVADNDPRAFKNELSSGFLADIVHPSGQRGSFCQQDVPACTTPLSLFTPPARV